MNIKELFNNSSYLFVQESSVVDSLSIHVDMEINASRPAPCSRKCVYAVRLSRRTVRHVWNFEYAQGYQVQPPKQQTCQNNHFTLDFCFNIYEERFLSNFKHSGNKSETNNVPQYTKFKVFRKIFVVERGSNMLQSGSSQTNNDASMCLRISISRGRL